MAEEGSDRAALVGIWHPAQVNPSQQILRDLVFLSYMVTDFSWPKSHWSQLELSILPQQLLAQVLNNLVSQHSIECFLQFCCCLCRALHKARGIKETEFETLIFPVIENNKIVYDKGGLPELLLFEKKKKKNNPHKNPTAI